PDSCRVAPQLIPSFQLWLPPERSKTWTLSSEGGDHPVVNFSHPPSSTPRGPLANDPSACVIPNGPSHRPATPGPRAAALTLRVAGRQSGCPYPCLYHHMGRRSSRAAPG